MDLKLHVATSWLAAGSTDCSPVTAFSSVIEARQRYEEISQAWIRHVWSGSCDYVLFLERLEQWNDAFKDFLEGREHLLDAQDRRGVALLEMHRRQFELSLQFVGVPPEKNIMWWDSKTSYLSEMVEYAAAAVELSKEVDTLSPSFSMESGINLHLYTVACRCRDPIIRRRALQVLRSANRCEGFWRTEMVYYVASKIIKLEEEGLDVQTCEDVPEEARLQNVVIVLKPDGTGAKARLWIRGKVIEEVLSWEDKCGTLELTNVELAQTPPAPTLQVIRGYDYPDREKRWYNCVVGYAAGSTL